MAHAVSYSFHTQTPTPFYTSPNLTASSNNQGPEYNLAFYLSIYIAFSVAGAVLGTLRYFYIYTGAIRASRVLFDNLCFTVLRTPLRWVDTVPLGRILNRFTADFEVIDARLSGDISGGLHAFLQLCGIITAG
jgi:ABC-type multidrug transport system fused ATPase/permease subunit